MVSVSVPASVPQSPSGWHHSYSPTAPNSMTTYTVWVAIPPTPEHLKKKEHNESAPAAGDPFATRAPWDMQPIQFSMAFTPPAPSSRQASSSHQGKSPAQRALMYEATTNAPQADAAPKSPQEVEVAPCLCPLEYLCMSPASSSHQGKSPAHRAMNYPATIKVPRADAAPKSPQEVEVAPGLCPLEPEKLERPTKKLFACQTKNSLGRFVPVPNQANKTPANSGARPAETFAGHPAKRRKVESCKPVAISGRTRATRAIHAQERRNQHISAGRKNVTLPHVYVKASKIKGKDGKPAGKGLFTKKKLPAGAWVSEYGIHTLHCHSHAAVY